MRRFIHAPPWIVRTETRAAMQQCGVRSVKELNPGFGRRAT